MEKGKGKIADWISGVDCGEREKIEDSGEENGVDERKPHPAQSQKRKTRKKAREPPPPAIPKRPGNPEQRAKNPESQEIA